MKKNIIHIIFYIILIVTVIFLFRKPAIVVDNSHIYELRIDSIRDSILEKNIIIDSLENVIEVNDLQIGILVKNVERLINERNENRIVQNERDREITNMSNDSLVLFVRDQLRLWAAE